LEKHSGSGYQLILLIPIHSSKSNLVCASRIGFNRDRPLLVGNPRAKWQELMNIRRPIYESLATLTVSTDSGTPSQIAQEVADILSKTKEVNS